MEKKDAIQIDASLGSGFAIVGVSLAAYVIQAASVVQARSGLFWFGLVFGGLLSFYGASLLSRAAREWRSHRKNLEV